MIQIQLIAKNGRLHFPCGGDKNDDRILSLLTFRHYEGDTSVCPWPMKDKHRERLACALYDERESNAYWPNVPVSILLPDGKPFDFDAVLADAEPYTGHQREYNPDNFRGV